MKDRHLAGQTFGQVSLIYPHKRDLYHGGSGELGARAVASWTVSELGYCQCGAAPGQRRVAAVQGKGGANHSAAGVQEVEAGLRPGINLGSHSRLECDTP